MPTPKGWAALLVGALCWAGAAEAAGPSLVANLGGTFGSSDEPHGGGFSAALSALWSAEPVWFGPMLFADDLGTRVGRLTDPNDGSDLGAVAEIHRTTYGGAWRMDVPIRLIKGWPAYAGAAVGYYRIRDDQLGVVEQVFSSTGLSVAAGLTRPMGNGLAIGASARFHRVFDDRQNYYASATLDLLWQPGGARKANPEKGKAPEGGK